MSTTVVAIAVGLVLVVGFVAKLAAQGGKVTQYFENAVRAYLWADDAPAGLAALASAKTAAPAQRGILLAHLMQLAGQLSSLIEQVPELSDYKVRLDRLAQEIAAKDWTSRDAEAAKHELGEASPQYLSALNKFDPAVFASRHPALFQASGLVGWIEAAEQEKRAELERSVEVMKQLQRLEGFQEPSVAAVLVKSVEQGQKDLESSGGA